MAENPMSKWSPERLAATQAYIKKTMPGVPLPGANNNALAEDVVNWVHEKLGLDPVNSGKNAEKPTDAVPRAKGGPVKKGGAKWNGQSVKKV